MYSIASNDRRTLLPDEGDGPFSVNDFNTASGHASQRGKETLWLTYCPTDRSIEIISKDVQSKRRRIDSKLSIGDNLDVICWEPYGGDGHYFGLHVKNTTEVIVLDTHVGCTVLTTIEDFLAATIEAGECVLRFFTLSMIKTASVPVCYGVVCI